MKETVERQTEIERGKGVRQEEIQGDLKEGSGGVEVESQIG